MVIKVDSGEIDDLATLNILNEENLLRELRLRYRKGIIYVSNRIIELSFTEYSFQTYIGDVLLAVNPFKQLNIYERQVRLQERGSPGLKIFIF